MAARGSHKTRGPSLLAALGAVTAAALVAIAGPARAMAGPAIGQFELKSLEAGAGYLEFQSLNAWSVADPGPDVRYDGGELLTDGNTRFRQRHALEVEAGLSEYLKIRLGIEFEKEQIEEPEALAEVGRYSSLSFDEVGAELIGVILPRKGDGFGLGAVVEYERPLEKGAMQGVMLGPIIEWAWGPWFVSAMPAAVHHFGGEAEEDGSKDRKWDFAYALQLAYEVPSGWTLAIEAFGTVDRLGNTGERGRQAVLFGDHDQHRLGPIVYYEVDLGRSLHPWRKAGEGPSSETSKMEIGVGYLFGLNEATPGGTMKLSVEVEF